MKTKKDILKALAVDAKHAGVKTIRLTLRRMILDCVLPNYSYKYIKLLRYKDYYLSKGGEISRLIAKYYEIRLHKLGTEIGFYIPSDVFGEGLYIPHIGSVVVNPNAKVGKNCQINNNVVIGQVNGYAPTIGDNVYIGPGAVVSGNIFIADNVWIGANAVVTKSIVDEGALVAGVPATIVAIKNLNWVEAFSKIGK